VIMQLHGREEPDRSAFPSPIIMEHIMNQEQFGQF